MYKRFCVVNKCLLLAVDILTSIEEERHRVHIGFHYE